MIGVARLVLLKTSNYSFSTQEYGEHWNFFFTLFFVRVSFRIGEKSLLSFKILEKLRN
jgi:hypothetical protein